MGAFETTQSFQDQNLTYDQRVSTLERALVELIRQLKQASLAAPDSSGNVVPAAIWADINKKIGECISALEALRTGRGSSPEEVKAVERKLLAVERQILSTEAQQFASVCASVSIRNRYEQRLSELRQQAANVRGQLQVVTGPQRDEQTRKYLLGDRDAVRRAPVQKRGEHQTVLDDLRSKQQDNERKILEARRGPQDAAGKKRIAELEEDQRRLVAMIAATRRHLEGCRRDLEQFDQRPDDRG
jgi:hypothetical protein